MTRQTLHLLEVLISDPARDWYGLELMDQAELRSGTVYPLLHRLQADGWLTSVREEIDPSREGRPRRRLYRLTALGQTQARKALARNPETPRKASGARVGLRPDEATA